jgi:trimethylamine--corrinoid protein Co-methyltransferase
MLAEEVNAQNEASSKKSRRASGGRAARHALREAGTEGKVVHVGLEGGQYKPLSDAAVERIHNTALDVLEHYGIGEPIEEVLKYALPKGCWAGEDGRLKIPRNLVEEVIANTPKVINVYGRNPKYDFVQEGTKVNFSTGGEGVTVLDYDTQTYRPSRLQDLYDMGRLVDQLEHIHMYGQPFVATEYSEDIHTHDINIAYAGLASTAKPFALGISDVRSIDTIIDMFDTYLGEPGAFLKRPFCTFGGCPIVSPLRFGEENAQVMVRCAELGLDYDIAIAAQAGATAPAALAGSLVQTFAETLACLVIYYCVNPKAGMRFGMWPFISDLRTGSFTGGSGEQALVMAATSQICNHYGLISSVATGMSDAKTFDAQAGYEKAVTTLCSALAGGNSIAAYAGSIGSIIGTSFEGLLIDNDMLGMILRVVRGIEVNDETLSYDVIGSTIYGAGHFLNQEQTLKIMETEYLYPDVADRRTSGEWQNTGKEDMYELARRKTKKMLADYYPQYIAPEVDDKIRAKFPIKLSKTDMQPGNGRW